jgi:hypothetical protein
VKTISHLKARFISDGHTAAVSADHLNGGQLPSCISRMLLPPMPAV